MTDPAKERLMTLGRHLDELRSRLILCLLCLGAAFVLCWAFKHPVMSLVARPHVSAMRSLGRPEKLLLIRYTEGFLSYMKVCFLAAVFVSSPFLAYQTWRFVSAGLRQRERRLVRVFAPASVGLFLLGGAFAYFVLIPLGLRFLLAVGGQITEPAIAMGAYTSLVITLALLTGLIFELPLVMMFLARIGVAEYGTFARWRRPAILLAFVLGAMLTPPDPFTQIMLAVPMIALYEIGLTLSFPSLRNCARLLGVVAAGAGIAACVWLYALRSGTDAATVIAAHGSATLRVRGATKAEPIRAGASVAIGSLISSGAGGVLRLRLRNGVSVALNRGTSIVLGDSDALRLIRGEALAATRRKRPLRIEIAEITLYLRRCEANVRMAPRGVEVTAVKGVLDFTFRGVRGKVLPGRRRVFSLHGEPVDAADTARWAKPED